MQDYRQDPPFAVQIELVEGCTLSCEFCGVNGIREQPGNFKFMSANTIENVARQIRDLDWNPRIELAMHGEPSMHPEVEDRCRALRRILGDDFSIVMFSNGSGFFRNTTLNGVLEAGVNTIGLDAYEHVNVVPRLMSAYDGRYPVYQYPLQLDHNLHSGRRVGRRDIVVIEDIVKAIDGNHSDLNTHCGAGMKPSENLPLRARCAKPFRELSIRWDGNVAICCNDFRGIYKIGSVVDDGLDAVWQHARMNAARKALYHRDRDFDPCRWCSAKSTRVGLLPDQKGVVELEEPTEQDRSVMDVAASGPAYSSIVLRPWEMTGREAFRRSEGVLYPINVVDRRKGRG